MEEIRTFRIYSFEKNNKYYSICLDTDIVVRGETMEESHHKMKDAMLSYLKTFSTDEILAYKYMRKAPIVYRLRAFWFALLLLFFQKLKEGNLSSAKFNYSTNNLEFA